MSKALVPAADSPSQLLTYVSQNFTIDRHVFVFVAVNLAFTSYQSIREIMLSELLLFRCSAGLGTVETHRQSNFWGSVVS
jgi:hypothetical protein